MRYAVFTDVHANLEALEAVLAKIDELAKEKPIDEIWFLGDLVGYGPNPNECITTLRERTDIIIAGNHDWAAVGKIDLEDFSAAARISAEWTAEQLTEEHRSFLENLPEQLEIGECTLVHGSPYGPLWEYLTSEVLAERSFQYFSTRYCFVGHTHVPVIFQQPDVIATAPTLPLVDEERNGITHPLSEDTENLTEDVITSDEIEETPETEMAAVQPPLLTTKTAAHAESAYADPDTGQLVNQEDANAIHEIQLRTSEPSDQSTTAETSPPEHINHADVIVVEDTSLEEADEIQHLAPTLTKEDAVSQEESSHADSKDTQSKEEAQDTTEFADEETQELRDLQDASDGEATEGESTEVEQSHEVEVTPEATIANAEDRLNSEIEELLALLGLSESMIQVTNEMSVPPEGHWEAKEEHRAIINPGGVGQPRDGDPRAAFMIYDTEEGFEFYRIPYPFNKTQEKIIKAGLPQYLAVRLAYGR